MEEESFPRGGVISKTDRRKSSPQRGVFNKTDRRKSEKGKVKSTAEGKSKRSRKEKRGKKEQKDGVSESKEKKHKMEGEVSGQVGQEHPQFLSKKFLYPGMLLLGYIKQIKNYSLTVALPNGLSGTVPITNISKAYTESLQRFSESHDENAESVNTLTELFKVGMVVPCKLTEFDKTAGAKTLTLSINPQDVNEDLSAASFRHGMCVYGNVASHEDHGYVLDIGVRGVQAFLKNKHAARYIQLYSEGEALRVGQCMMCKVKMKGDRMAVLAGQHRVISVTIDPLDIKNIERAEGVELSFSSLLPGMKMHANVAKVVKDEGIVVEFHKFRGVVHKSHLPKLPESYSHAEQVTCSVMYIHPLIKTITLTMLPHLTDYAGVPVRMFHKIKVGDIVEEGLVKKADRTRGVYLDLQNGCTGFAGLNNCSDQNVENVQKAFKNGSKHRCRVVGFYPMEAVVIVTMKKSIVDEKYMRVTDINAGDLIECKVKKLVKNGISVDVHKGIMGFIPTLHLADITLQHPEQKFKVGDKLQCRVLYVNKKHSKVTLTHKKSLVSTKYAVVTSYQQIEAGQLLEGYISVIKDFGCFVRFYKDVQGLAPRPLLSTEPIPYPEKVFYKGQVVRCKVVHVDPSTKQLKLTFVLEGKTEFGQKIVELPQDFKIGKLVKCNITKKSAIGLDVQLLPSKMTAFIPKMHLSDSKEMCDALWAMYQPGDTIEEAMYWNVAKMPILTCKPCLLAKADNGDDFVTTFDAFQPGMMLAGAVKNITSYGIFIDFPSGQFGLVPLQYCADRKVKDINILYRLGQTVIAKVLEVNKEKQRCLLSLRMQDCYHGNTETGVELTWNHLKERQRLLDSLQKTENIKGTLSQIMFGSIHKITVKKMTELGAVCELDNGVKAVVIKDHMKGKISVDDSLDCVILYVDVRQNCVEVSLDNRLVLAVKKRHEKNMEGAAVNQTLKATVLVIKEDFVVVSLRSHATGQLAYLPSKRHWNDVLERHQYDIGQENKVIIKKVEGDVVLVSLKVHEDKEVEDEDKLYHIPEHTLALGDICDATVRKIYKDSIFINLSGTHGRVHVTEMLDHVENGSRPAEAFTKNQQITVRIIGFREGHSMRYLPISHPNIWKAMPDCTMKPSMLSMKELPEKYTCSRNNFRIGDKVVTFVDKYQGECMYTQVSACVKGRVHILNMSDDLQKLKKPAHHFQPAQCYNSTVINIINFNLVELSLLETPLEVSVGKQTAGVVKCVRKDSGLVLLLADYIQAIVDLTDMSDNYISQPTSAYKNGDIVVGKLMELEKLSRQGVFTMRQDIPEREPIDPRIGNISDLSLGQTVRGYIINVTNKGVTVRLGPGIKALVSPASMVEGKHVMQLRTHFKVGNVITVKYLGFDKNNDLACSLLKEDIGQSLNIPRSCLSDFPITTRRTIRLRKKRKRTLSISSVDSESDRVKKAKLKNIETCNEIDDSIKLEIDDVELMESVDMDDDGNSASSAEGSNGDEEIDDDAGEEIDEEIGDKDLYNLRVSFPATGEDEENNERHVTETDDKIVAKGMTRSVFELESVKEQMNSRRMSESEDADITVPSIEHSNKKLKRERKSKKRTNSESDKDGNETVSSPVKSGGEKMKRKDHKQTDSESDADEAVTGTEHSSKMLKTRKKNKKRTSSQSDKHHQPESPSKKRKDTKRIEGVKPALGEEESDSGIEVKVVAKTNVKSLEKPVLNIEESFSWETEFKMPSAQQGEITTDDSDDEESQRSVKKTKEQLRQERKDEEQKLYQSEMQRLEGEAQPETADDFDRMVLQSPDSSLVWLRYMAFHLEMTEIDKTRAVAERALRTISFREEQEKLNVWVAYLNLENMYGSVDSLRKVLSRAVQQNDQISIYLQMINIYVKSSKPEDAEQLLNTLVKKNSGNKDIWIKYGEFYFQQGRVESARKLLQRCLKSLDMKFHVDTIIKFAQMEFKYGEPERGKTMFENTLSTYPKRTDLWSIYIDMVTKLGEFDNTRSIYDRVIAYKMSAKKMKFFFKKYLQFEEKHGSPVQVAEVKKKALQYVESHGFVDE